MMALRRVYDTALDAITSTLHDGYMDRLGRWSDIQEYLPYLYETAKSYEHVRVLELGSRKGNSTLAFLAAAVYSDGHVVSVDIDPVADDPAGMRPWRRTPRWTFIQGDDMDEFVQAKLPPQVDILFIDTSHEYEHTLAELYAYMPRLSNKGVALFHDTNLIGWPGYDWKGTVPPVQEALDVYCASTGKTWENLPGTYGLGILRS